jgi:hypothetical protein
VELFHSASQARIRRDVEVAKPSNGACEGYIYRYIIIYESTGTAKEDRWGGVKFGDAGIDRRQGMGRGGVPGVDGGRVSGGSQPLSATRDFRIS